MSPIVGFVRIEIWSDVVCPWCYIGKRRFDAALERLSTRINTEHIEVVYRSYQLDPTAPESTTTPAVDAYAKKFGGEQRALQIINHVTSIAAGDGITFHMDKARRANTLLAHRVLHWVRENHGNDAQSACKELFLAGYFSRGLDVSDLDVLVSLCAETGLKTDGLTEWISLGGGIEEVHEDFRQAAAREITAVPSYVINDQFIIPGAQDIELFEQVIEKIASR